MANFETALAAMRGGKTVRRAVYSKLLFITKHGLRDHYTDRFVGSLETEDILAADWQIHPETVAVSCGTFAFPVEPAPAPKPRKKWLPHDGGACPVPLMKMVKFKMVGGSRSVGWVLAHDVPRWPHIGAPSDITHYRIKEPKP